MAKSERDIARERRERRLDEALAATFPASDPVAIEAPAAPPPLEAVDNPAAGRFEVRLGDEVAFTEYRLTPEGIVLPRTLVPPAFEGMGVASTLVRAALAFARARGALVIPRCAFVAGYIKRHPEVQDLVHPDYRVTG